MRNRKIGLALGSGAARGLAHIGPTDFRHAQDCIEHGELADLASILEIRQKLEA